MPGLSVFYKDGQHTSWQPFGCLPPPGARADSEPASPKFVFSDYVFIYPKPEMNTAADVSALARHLFETQGAKAIAEAAQKAASFEDAGDQEQAKFWRRVEAVLFEMRGPRQS